MKNREERIKHIFKFMEYGNITDSQHDLVVSFEEQFDEKGRLSEKQYQILESIFQRAAEES